jgi:hypothetical protein
MLTPGANFAEAVGVRLNLPTQGVRSVIIPGALIVLASAHVAREKATCANCNAHAPTLTGVTLSVTIRPNNIGASVQPRGAGNTGMTMVIAFKSGNIWDPPICCWYKCPRKRFDEIQETILTARQSATSPPPRKSKPSTPKSESRVSNPAFHFGAIVNCIEIQCMTARPLLRYSFTPRP